MFFKRQSFTKKGLVLHGKRAIPLAKEKHFSAASCPLY